MVPQIYIHKWAMEKPVLYFTFHFFLFIAIKALNFAEAKYEVHKESNDSALRVNKVLEWKK